MKTLSYLSILFSVFSLGSLARANENMISISEVLEKAKLGPSVEAAKANARAANETATSTFRKIYLPKLQGSLSYSHLLQDQSVQIPSIPTAIGTFNVPPFQFSRNTTWGAVYLVQPLLDPENMLFNGTAAKNMAEAETLKASHQEKETQSNAIRIYLQILELRSKREALDKFVKNLKGRQPEVKRLYQLGHVSESDVLKIKMGIDDANQGIREIIQKEIFLGRMLANVIGDANSLSPDDLPDNLPTKESFAKSIHPEYRDDIRSIDKQLEALEKSESASRASYLPKMAVIASHYFADIDSLERKNFDTLGVQLSWSIFDSGAGLANARANAEKRFGLEKQKGLAMNAISSSYADAINMLNLKRQEYEERRSAVTEAKKVADLEFKRLQTGKSTVNNLIDAEDVLKDRLEKASLSKINWYQAWFAAQLTSGAELTAP